MRETTNRDLISLLRVFSFFSGYMIVPCEHLLEHFHRPNKHLALSSCWLKAQANFVCSAAKIHIAASRVRQERTNKALQHMIHPRGIVQTIEKGRHDLFT
jgi:hypothetical protein